MSSPENWRGSVQAPRVPQLGQASVERSTESGSSMPFFSAYDVKLHAVPVLYRALDEPSAYEWAEPGRDLNDAAARSLG